MKLSPEVSEACQSIAPIHWQKFYEEFKIERTNRFVGSKDPTKALEFFAEMEMVKLIISIFIEESEKKSKK